MPSADTARLIASLELKDLFSKQLGNAEKSLGRFDKSLDSTQSRAYKAGTQIGTGIKRTAALAVGAIGFLAVNVEKGVSSLVKLDDVVTQTNAVLKSTKGAAGENAAAIRDLANKYEGLNATIDDTVIQSGENLLLTFTNIRKKAFEPTLQAALNMNQALGGGEAGLQGTIQRLGKALNDPVKGLTALQRVGVTFTKGQKEQIAAAVKAGDTFKAQSIILAELNKRFGGSFLAGGATTTGKIAAFRDAIDDLQRTLATALLPVIGKVAVGLKTFLADPAVIRGAKDIGDAIAGMFSDANLAAGADFLKGAFATAKSAAPVVASAAKATFGFVQAAVGLFKSLPPELQGLLAGGFALNKLTGGLVTNVAGGIIDVVGKALLQRGGTPANPLFVADVTGGLGKALGGAIPLGAGAAAEGAGLGLAAGSAALAAGVAVSALGIMGLGWLINATSSQAQIDQTAQNVIDENRRKHGLTGTSPSIGASLGDRDLANVTRAMSGTENNTGKMADDIGPLAGSLRDLRSSFHSDLWTLIHATKALDVQKAAKKIGDSIGKGIGNAANTEKSLGALKHQLTQTDDAKTRAVLKAQIARVEHVLPDRQFAAKQYGSLNKILADGKITTSENKQIHRIMAAVKDRGLPAVQKGIQAKIDAARKSQQSADAAIKGAVHADTQAIKDKDLSVTINNAVTANVSFRDMHTVSVRASAFGRVAS